MSTAVMVVLVVFIEAFLHYFPYRLILKGRELPRVIAYVLGVLGLMGPFSAWLIELKFLDILFTLWLVIIAGGMSVLSLYGLDRFISLEWKVKEGNEREHLLQEQADGKGE